MNFSFKITFFQKFSFRNKSKNTGEDAEESTKCKVYTKVGCANVLMAAIVIICNDNIVIAVNVVNFVAVVSGRFQVPGFTGKDCGQVRHRVGHGGR